MIEETRYPRKISWPVLIVFIVLTALLLIIFDKAVAQDQDPKAVEIAQKTMKAMGGIDQWKSVAAIRFDFRVERPGAEARGVKHLWDRRNGRDHIEGTTRDGKAMVAWIDISKQSGAAWQDGKKLEGAELKNAMEWAYNRWVNDTYWLIMPLKLLDKGVNLKYEGGKGDHDVLHISFGKVGLTPGDQYWAFINKDTGLMDRWQFLLQDEKEKSIFEWKEWGNYGPMKLSKSKENPADKTTIRFEPLQVLDSADASYFSHELKKLN